MSEVDLWLGTETDSDPGADEQVVVLVKRVVSLQSAGGHVSLPLVREWRARSWSSDSVWRYPTALTPCSVKRDIHLELHAGWQHS